MIGSYLAPAVRYPGSCCRRDSMDTYSPQLLWTKYSKYQGSFKSVSGSLGDFQSVSGH